MTTVAQIFTENGQNKDKKKGTKGSILRKKIHGMTKDNKVQPSTWRHQEGRKELTINCKNHGQTEVYEDFVFIYLYKIKTMVEEEPCSPMQQQLDYIQALVIC